MPYQIFSIAIPDVGNQSEELNVFLCTHRIIDKHWETVVRDGVPYQVCRVEYVGGSRDASEAMKGSSGSAALNRRPSPVDYREVLSAEDFRIFDELRKVRRKIAEAEKVDAFLVFTNAQLAEMVTGKSDSLESLSKIKGIGESHLKKYGSMILEGLRNARTSQKQAAEGSAKDDAGTEESRN